MLDRKKNKFNHTIDGENQNLDLKAFEMPEVLANLSTGLDVFKLDIEKLISAPEEWNFYSKLSDSKMDELVESIINVGLMHPLVVWEQKDGTYMILSGHNRKMAYEILFQSTKDDKYKKIYCYVKKHAELDEEKAKEIIIDTNWVQRQLSPMERARSIYEKYTNVSRNKNIYKAKGQDGHTRDIIAQQYNISGRQVSKYYRLNFLIDEFQKMLANNNISINIGVKLSNFIPEIQKLILENYIEVLDANLLDKLKSTMDKDEVEVVILDHLNEINDKDVSVSYKLRINNKNKEEFEREFEELLKKYNIEKM